MKKITIEQIANLILAAQLFAENSASSDRRARLATVLNDLEAAQPGLANQLYTVRRCTTYLDEIRIVPFMPEIFVDDGSIPDEFEWANGSFLCRKKDHEKNVIAIATMNGQWSYFPGGRTEIESASILLTPEEGCDLHESARRAAARHCRAKGEFDAKDPR